MSVTSYPTISGRSSLPTWLELMAMPPRFHNARAYTSTILWSAIALAPVAEAP